MPPTSTTVAFQLLERIVGTGRAAGAALTDGSVLTIDAVSDQFGVSRPTATAAIHKLIEKGVLRNRQRTGAVVQPRAHWLYLDAELLHWLLDAEQLGAVELVQETRRGIESAAARAAASRIQPHQYDPIMTAALRIYDLGYRQGKRFGHHWRQFGDVDATYHGLILRASGNHVFQAFESVIARVLWARLQNRDDAAPGDAGPDDADRFPKQPKPEAMILHVAQAKSVIQRKPDAAEVITQAIMAEFATGLDTPYMRAGLAHALHHDLQWSASELKEYGPLLELFPSRPMTPTEERR
ncbi:FCD domain-containing protein [Actinoplanes sp. NPDC049802]|uniref:FadR/GntR family transcriptional regulator n=1 Tax=Actinoplanes sp. NPDC049802 TaxID=3154742 RepID=UPI0033D6300F